MITAAACLLALCMSGPSPQIDSASTAYSVYKGCIQGTIYGRARERGQINTQKQVVELAKRYDNFCIAWTSIWMQEATNSNGLTTPEVDRFNEMRYKLMQGLIHKLSDTLPKL